MAVRINTRVPSRGAVRPFPVPPERAETRKALRERGVPTYEGVYPPDAQIPEPVAKMSLRLPFIPGTRVVCIQPNNSMREEASHRPDRLRYAIDFYALDRSAGLQVTAAEGGTAHVYDGAREGKGDNWGYGNFVLLDHGNGYASLYAHLGEIEVGNGEAVQRGTQLGAVGNTGLAGGPHLHFQVVELSRQPNPEAERHHEGDGRKVPPPPFGVTLATVPFAMLALDKSRGDEDPRRIVSTEFAGNEVFSLPGREHTYEAPAE